MVVKVISEAPGLGAGGGLAAHQELEVGGLLGREQDVARLHRPRFERLGSSLPRQMSHDLDLLGHVLARLSTKLCELRPGEPVLEGRLRDAGLLGRDRDARYLSR